MDYEYRRAFLIEYEIRLETSGSSADVYGLIQPATLYLPGRYTPFDEEWQKLAS